jgi:DNA-binding LytR/AlgR family response regulator
MSAPALTALIAEDEPLLAAALQAELAQAWPELRIVAVVGDGHSAVAKTLELQPDVLFFDIQMPGQSGLEAAMDLADQWPLAAPADNSLKAPKRFPSLVFVTAYDQYAVQAFEAQAVDYILKPINQSRLNTTVKKLISSHELIEVNATNFDDILSKLSPLFYTKSQKQENYLQIIQASVGSAIHMVKVAEVLCFEAADKYVRVLAQASGAPRGHGTSTREYLIRTPLKELLPQLDPAVFWQVHRGTVVRAARIELVSRDEAGKLWLQLDGVPEKIAVSRLWAHLFKAM